MSHSQAEGLISVKDVVFELSIFAQEYGVSEKQFELGTGRKYPWEQGVPRTKRYALCPVCNNPVRLVGLYKSVKPKPYGAHVARNVPGLPAHNDHRYANCPRYVGITPINENARYDEPEPHQLELCQVLRDNIHKIIYVAESTLDIRGTVNFWRKCIEKFVGSKGYLYPRISIDNLPWLFLYFGANQADLYRQNVKLNSDMHRAIVSNCSNAKFEISSESAQYGALVRGDGYLDNISLRFTGYEVVSRENTAYEKMTIYVDFRDREIYKAQLDVVPSLLRRMLRSRWDDNKRNKALQDVATEVMAKLGL